MSETPFFLDTGASRLFAILHGPDDGAAEDRGAVLVCHGFTGHHIDNGRLLVEAARRIAREGLFVMRFDYRGCGDSLGSFADGLPGGYIDDATAALARLRCEPGVDPRRVGLLGFSVGGYVATHLADRDRAIPTMAIWSGVAIPEEVLRDADTGRRTPSGEIDLAGTPVAPGFIDDFRSRDPLAALGRAGIASLLVAHGTEDAAVPFSQAAAWARTGAAAGADVERLDFEGAGHLYERIEWRRDLIAGTATWLARALRATPTKTAATETGRER